MYSRLNLVKKRQKVRKLKNFALLSKNILRTKYNKSIQLEQNFSLSVRTYVSQNCFQIKYITEAYNKYVNNSTFGIYNLAFFC